LTEELQLKKYSQEEIKSILAWIEDIHNGDVYTLEEVYESLFNKKQIHIHA
jgi:predicted transcriptional regulator